jgi:hypothetical protein
MRDETSYLSVLTSPLPTHTQCCVLLLKKFETTLTVFDIQIFHIPKLHTYRWTKPSKFPTSQNLHKYYQHTAFVTSILTRNIQFNFTDTGLKTQNQYSRRINDKTHIIKFPTPLKEASQISWYTLFQGTTL